MKNHRRIAILGGGFAGLSFAYQAAWRWKNISIDLYDPKAIDKRASARAFLLHSFIHPKSILNWKGQEAFLEAEKQILSVYHMTKIPFFAKRPFLKLANHPKLIAPFQEAHALYPEVRWQEHTRWGHPGLWIDQAYQIEGHRYLEALEGACRLSGVHIFQTKPNSLQNYDCILYACGDKMQRIFPGPFSDYTLIKGQIIELKRPPRFELSHAISAYKCHLIPSFNQKTWLLASTYERSYESEEPRQEAAEETLLPKLNFLPIPFTSKDILNTYSGIRFYAPDKMPKLGRLDEKSWVLTALGSKGMLYHAYLAHLLCECMEKDSCESLPEKLRFSSEECLHVDKVR